MATEPDSCELLCLDLPKAEAARAGCPTPTAWRRGRPAPRRWPTRRGSRWPSRWPSAGRRACAIWRGSSARDEKLVSHHVRALRAAGLASSARDGKMVMYTLTDRGRALLAAVTATPASA